MRKVACVDCDKKREAYRPVARLVDGTVTFACRQCWRARLYDGDGLKTHDDDHRQAALMYPVLSAADVAALRSLR